MNILGYIGAIKNLDELVDIQDYAIEHQPCIIFSAITYPTGNTGYFFSVAENGNYNGTSIGKDMYDRSMRALYTDMQPILDS